MTNKRTGGRGAAALAIAVLLGGAGSLQAQMGSIPAPLGVPQPGPETTAPYAPTAILPGGVIVPLYAPGSPYLNPARMHEAERYSLSQSAPGRVNNIVNIHNPSIEVHTVDGPNTGTAVILIAGGGHNTLNVGPEAADFVPFFYNYGVNTVILRNRLRSDGYDPQRDGVRDVEQAIRLVRAHAREWHLDPHKIGILGFSAGGELASFAAVGYPAFDQPPAAQAAGPANQPANQHADPLQAVSARPDFVGLVYPGPTPFAAGRPAPTVPPDAPPAFLVSGGTDDAVHAAWADDYFRAMLNARVPDIEMHIYAAGRHPGELLRDGSHMGGGLSDRQGTPYGTWQFRFIDWFRDLGFLGKPGVETRAADDLHYALSTRKATTP